MNKQIANYTRELTRFTKRNIAPLIFSFVALTASVMMGCDDRGNPVFEARSPQGIDSWTRGHSFVETQFTQFNDLPTTAIRVYTPPGYAGKGLGRPYPVLYLLSPFRGDQFFYLHNGLQVAMDRMIAEGTIEPMIVVTVNGSGNPFGGSFYTNYITNGNYENLVTNSLVPFIDTEFNTFGNLTMVGAQVNTPQLRAGLRAVSGYEMGGYGAVRTALTSDTSFGSVSAVSAPLYFSDPQYGFPAMFNDAIAEWGSYDAIDSAVSAPVSGFLLAAAIGFSPEDTAYTFNPSDKFKVDTIHKILDSSIIDTLIDTFPLESNIVFIDTFFFDSIDFEDTTFNFDSMELIDSLIDSTFLDIVDTNITTNEGLIDTIITIETLAIIGTLVFTETTETYEPVPPDTVFDTTGFIDTTIDTTFTPFDTVVDTTVDTIDTIIGTDTIVTDGDTTFDIRTQDTFTNYNPPTDLTFPAFPDLKTGEDGVLRVFMPFDSTGQPYDSIWPLWVRNDAPTIVDNADPSILSAFSDNILLMATRQAKFNHFQQDSLFWDKLNTMGYTAHFSEYSGYDGFADIDGARYLFEVWPTLLKFHSDRIHPFVPSELQVQNYQMGF